MKSNMREEELRKHLESFGIRHFDGDEYWSWGGQALGEKLGSELDQLREPIVEGVASAGQRRRFYDFIAQPPVAAVVHSSKADAILRSGLFIESQLPDAGVILDLGCSIGYLTTFYAMCGSNRALVGWDWSKTSVNVAVAGASQRQIQNVSFVRHDICDYSEPNAFDVICSGQTLGTPELGHSALAKSAESLRLGGRLVCVEPFGLAEPAEAFVAAAADLGLAVRHHEFVLFRDLGQAGAYPAFVFEKYGDTIDVDLKASYAQVLQRLSL